MNYVNQLNQMNKKIKYLLLTIGFIFIEYVLIDLIMFSYFLKHQKVDGSENESNKLTYLLLFILLIVTFFLIKYLYVLIMVFVKKNNP
jgi:hypothetical protein